MLAKKNERPKIYLGVALSIVLLVVLYFRYAHKKPTHAAAPARVKPGVERLHVPQIQLPHLKSATRPKASVNASRRIIPRDIFRPLKGPLPKGQAHRQVQKASKAVPPLKLTGTIVGGEEPMAVINGQFVHTGDRIGEYRVVTIGEKKVLLDSGEDQIALEILKNE
jgi:hypothetical protein